MNFRNPLFVAGVMMGGLLFPGESWGSVGGPSGGSATAGLSSDVRLGGTGGILARGTLSGSFFYLPDRSIEAGGYLRYAPREGVALGVTDFNSRKRWGGSILYRLGTPQPGRPTLLLGAESLGVSDSDSYYGAVVGPLPLAPEEREKYGRDATAYLGWNYGASSFAPGRITNRESTLFGGLILPATRHLSLGLELTEGHTVLTLGGSLSFWDLQLRWEGLADLGCSMTYCYRVKPPGSG